MSEPVRGAMNGGVTGLATGVAKGVMMATCETTAGALDVVTLTSKGATEQINPTPRGHDEP